VFGHKANDCAIIVAAENHGGSMSTNNESTEVNASKPGRRGSIVALSAAVLVVALVAATLLYQGNDTQPVQNDDMARLAALASDHSPTLGDASAKVHIVEFLDPACETCALFFPMVKTG
jgi:protein-disulfide isomerase